MARTHHTGRILFDKLRVLSLQSSCPDFSGLYVLLGMASVGLPVIEVTIGLSHLSGMWNAIVRRRIFLPELDRNLTRPKVMELLSPEGDTLTDYILNY